MAHDQRPPDPTAIHTLDDLVLALTKLRRREARKGQVQLSVRDLASRTGRAPSTLDAYLRGSRLCPADVYEDLLRALGIAAGDLRPWLDAWERVADAVAGRQPASPMATQAARRSELLPYSEMYMYGMVGERPAAAAKIGVVTGDLRRVSCADVWVNSENTDMRMSRFEEYSISAIIRFEGAIHDDTGRVVEDRIAAELARKVAGRTPVVAGTVVTTHAGGLVERNGVRYVIHVAAVQGEPGEGYRQVADVGRCVTNVLAEAERLAAAEPVRSILIPLLGTGVAGGNLEATVRAIVGAVVDHFSRRRDSRLRVVYILASTAREREICRSVLGAGPFVELPST
jgi:O-acetyl-ADP-ribose deacetylase (regulator of RNase III)